MSKKKRARAEREAFLARVDENNRKLLEVAERAEAALPPENRRPPGVSNSEWMREMLDRAQAELDRRKQAESGA